MGCFGLETDENKSFGRHRSTSGCGRASA